MNSPTSKQFINLTFQCFFYLTLLALFNPALAADARGQKLESFRVGLSLRDATVVEVLKEIEGQTEFRFVYDRKVDRLRNTYDIAYDNVSLRSVLELMSKDANLSFRRIDNTISIDVKPKAPPVPVVEVIFLTVRGTITDEDGIPLAGASVVEMRTNNGTIADFDGNYTIEVESDAVLQFSYLGYRSQEVAVDGRTSIDVQMDLDVAQLEDVVVVGYGTQRKSDVTGSISSVGTEDFNQGIVMNPGQLLQGKVPGVNISNVSGEPGASQDVIIRGVGSLRSGTTPLYVIDGFALDNSATGVPTNPLNFINPQDIQSIDVLKDASAAAIYGSRAANGVIVITTKKGRAGRTQMDLTVSTGFSSLANKVDVFSPDEFRRQVVAAGGTLEDLGANTDWKNDGPGTSRR